MRPDKWFRPDFVQVVVDRHGLENEETEGENNE